MIEDLIDKSPFKIDPILNEPKIFSKNKDLIFQVESLLLSKRILARISSNSSLPQVIKKCERCGTKVFNYPWNRHEICLCTECNSTLMGLVPFKLPTSYKKEDRTQQIIQFLRTLC